jgi:protein-L-isoaspartate(D-aspartate) O-methyltransferase
VAQLGYSNVLVAQGDLHGLPRTAPYDAIVIWGGVSEVPEGLIDQLAKHGRLVVPLGDADAQLVVRLRRGEDSLVSDTLGAAELPPLSLEDPGFVRFPWS